MRSHLSNEIRDMICLILRQEYAKSYGKAIGRGDLAQGVRVCEYCKATTQVVEECSQCGAPDTNKYGQGRGYCVGS